MKDTYTDAESQTAVAAALRAGAAIGAQQPKVPVLGTQDVKGFEVFPYVLAPTGYDVKNLKDLFVRDTPKRIATSVTLFDALSFNTYVAGFKDAATRVFCDQVGLKFSAILDYHESATQPRWGKHRVEFALRKTVEWAKWEAMDRKRVSQVEFAEFIEDNLPDIAEPSGQVILEVSRTLDATRTISFGSSVRLDNGEVQFAYNEKIEANVAAGTVRIPETFTLGIAPFEGAEKFSVKARLRYRLHDGGKLSIGFDLVQPHKVIEAAFDDASKVIEDGLGIVLLSGQPPVQGS